PQNFEHRKDVMFDQIETVQRLWAGESVDFKRADGKNVAVSTLPRPVQDTLPVWITAAGNPETFRLAAEKGYNVLTHLLGQSVDELAEKIKLYRDAQEKAGKSGGKITLMLHTFIGDSVDSVREIVREPMKMYLSTAMNLVKEAAWSFPTFKEMTMTNEGRFSMEHLSDDDQGAILDYAFDRYFETSGLFGSVESCAPFVDQLKAVGVDEIGCLIDYGVDVDLALSSLPELARLLRESNPAQSTTDIKVHGGDGQSGLAPFVASRNGHPEDVSMYTIAVREGVTHMQCTPSMARMLVADEEGQSVLKQLDHFLVGGEALDSELGRTILEHTSAKLVNMYGPTETTVWSTSHEVNGSEDTMPIGRPLANNLVYVLGRDGVPVPEGHVGELYIGGDGVTAGYLGRPDLTRDRFVDNPFVDREGKMYRTGDLCRFRSDGVLEFLGRNDQQVKVRGYRIELGEIEKAIRERSSVAEVAVTVENRNGDHSIVAYVVESSDGAFDSDEVRVALEHLLPPYMIPSQFNVLSAFPRTPNGKLDRNALATQKPKAAVPVTAAEVVAPSGDFEQTIADTWREILEIETISVTDNFFDIGGHSLLAVQVNAKLSAVLGESLSLIDLFRFPTVRSFAQHLSDRDEGKPSQAVVKGSSRAEARRAAMNRRSR
ncbi:MAG: LLM class flavin-dependent oxidoreductase, partial [Rhodothermales bacterium]|nr:LLM class flavin-dependent oxidoreductase [Rhodothermales bacterium]